MNKDCCHVLYVHRIGRTGGIGKEGLMMATIYISGGRKDNMRPGDILGALTKDAGLMGKDVGNIQIFEGNSYAAIAADQVDVAVDRLNSGKIKGRKFRVGKAVYH